jgi:predicted metal-dependent hydrolase
MTEVRLAGAGSRVVEVHVRRSRRARRLRLWAPPRRPLELVVPWRTPERMVESFLRASEPWLAAQAAAAERPSALGLDRAGIVWLAGEEVPVTVTEAPRAAAALRGGVLEVRASGSEDAQAAVDRWYRREARVRLEAAVAAEAPLLGVWPARIAVRDTTSRFGSCSTSGTVSFSWRLVVAPPEVLDYVVVHELCHLREANHSHRFWALVEAARPGWREHRAWLNEHGHELLGYVPALR